MSKRKDQRQDKIETAAELPSTTEVKGPVEAATAAAEAATAAAAPKIETKAAESRFSANSEPIAAATPKAAAASYRFPLLAASVALAAALGAVTGSLGTMSLAGAPAAKPTDQSGALNLAKITSELSALKAGIEASNRLANTQFGKMTEAVSRLEQRIAAAPASIPVSAAASEITGSVPATNTVAKDASKPVVLEGWVLRDAYRGRALVENRHGLYEVVPGANLPGVGRIETIAQQNGRWVVVTPKGLIVSMR